MERFKKYFELLPASNSIKCNIIYNRTCLPIPKHSSIPKVSTQNTSSINVFLKISKVSNNTDRIMSLLQDQIEFLQEQRKSENKIINFIIKNLSRNDSSTKNSWNLNSLQTTTKTRTINSKRIQNKNTSGCFYNKVKKAIRGRYIEEGHQGHGNCKVTG